MATKFTVARGCVRVTIELYTENFRYCRVQCRRMPPYKDQSKSANNAEAKYCSLGVLRMNPRRRRSSKLSKVNGEVGSNKDAVRI